MELDFFLNFLVLWVFFSFDYFGLGFCNLKLNEYKYCKIIEYLFYGRDCVKSLICIVWFILEILFVGMLNGCNIVRIGLS